MGNNLRDFLYLSKWNCCHVYGNWNNWEFFSISLSMWYCVIMRDASLTTIFCMHKFTRQLPVRFVFYGICSYADIKCVCIRTVHTHTHTHICQCTGEGERDRDACVRICIRLRMSRMHTHIERHIQTQSSTHHYDTDGTYVDTRKRRQTVDLCDFRFTNMTYFIRMQWMCTHNS